MLLFICQECKKEFETQNRKRKFCSRGCSSTYNNKKRKGYRDITLVCDYCDKEFTRLRCGVEKAKKRGMKHSFCTEKCMGKFMRGQIRPHTSESVLQAYKEGRLKPTNYRNGGFRVDLGIYLRSNWEANYARILNYVGKEWEYEPEFFIVKINGKEHTYRPDFYLPEDGSWIEVKGYWANEISKQKFEAFSKNNRIGLIGEDEFVELAKQYQDKIENWEGRKY